MKLKVIESHDKGWGGFFGLLPRSRREESNLPDLCFAIVSYSGGGEGSDPWGASELRKARKQARANARELARRWNAAEDARKGEGA